MTARFFQSKPLVIAALHVPDFVQSRHRPMDWYEDYVVTNARVFAEAGVPWVKLQDQTRTHGPAAPETLAITAALARVLRSEVPGVGLGIIIEAHDPTAALAVAHAAGADFVRLKVFVGGVMTAQGPRHGLGAGAVAYRAALDRPDIVILSDVHDRTSIPLSSESQPFAAEWAAKTGADGLIITGSTFDDTLARIAAVREQGVRRPILVGGSVTEANVGRALEAADGVIVSSALMKKNSGGDDLLRWDVDLCRRFMDAARGGMSERDFAGYRGRVPGIRWPHHARIAVSVVVNVEEGAELSLGMGDERNESIYEAVELVEGHRDLCMESHFEYGPRAGWPRIRDALRARGIRATLNACGRALLQTPWIAEEAVADGHEVAAHGWRWERHAGMDEAQERDAMARTVDAISRIAGTPPLGWHTRSATSVRTRDLLVEHGGFLYDSNAYNDDLPYVVDCAAGPHIVLPYAFDTNDMRFFNRGGFVFASDFSRYCSDAFDRLYAEGRSAPRMLSIGLHTRVIGRPARIGGLEALLDYVLGHEGVWFATRAEIAHAWRAGLGLPEWQPRLAPKGFSGAS